MTKIKLNGNTAGRHPVVVTLLIVFVLIGILLMTGNIFSGAVAATIPAGYAKLWIILWVIGSVGTLFGLFVPQETITSLKVESFGAFCMGIAAIAYSISILGSSAFIRGGVAGLQALGIGLAWLVRFTFIRIELRTARKKAEHWLSATKQELR